MEDYIKIRELAKHLHIHRGQNLFVTSDVKDLVYMMMEKGDETDLNILIDGMIDIIGEEGSLVFPTFNWSFCKGIPYDHYKTPCKTGTLGKLALKRPDFDRTEHPIYSFAVWGKCREDMINIRNKSSFGADSPFTYMMEHDFDNLFIDKDLQHSFVFVHYVEEQNGPVPYRYLKDFTADYTDRNGICEKRTYSMNVRDLDMDVENRIYPYEPEFIEKGIMERFFVNGLEFKMIDLKRSYDIIADDVRNNKSRKLCSYIGQED
ncbi:MAG: AAC(3) family N-acetyltransferase [Lachnospiraceae bacterium]|nr:AAC(3) family N-acetyltransferase [Lachnospiraceae bacterium]